MELNEQIARTARHFAGVRVGPSRHSFRSLLTLFTALFFPANLPQDRKWIQCARLWRFILLQSSDWSWDLGPGLAGAPPLRFRF